MQQKTSKTRKTVKPHSAKPHGAKPHGAKPHGATSRGERPYGAKPHGAKPHGAKPRGATSRGEQPYGAKPHGATSRRERPYGAKPHGAKPHGAKPHGAKPRGERPYGAKPHGAKPHGAKPHGAKPHGATPRGERPYGAKPHGATPRGERPSGAKPHGAKPHGAKPRGATPHGERPRGVKPQGVRARAERTAEVRDTSQPLRLNKFLAEADVASRRKADELIRGGAVTVNGAVATQLGAVVDPAKDEVRVHGQPVTVVPQLVYVLLNKPKDCMTTTDDERGRRTVMDLIPLRQRLYPVGRLDRNTTGALLLTNDGDLAFGLTHPSFRVPKVYRAVLDRALRAPDLRTLREGVRLDDGVTAPCEAEILDAPAGVTVGLILHEGRNRQVRRMFEALGYGVRKLERTAYAGLTAAGLRRGEWRFLREPEVRALQTLLRRRER